MSKGLYRKLAHQNIMTNKNTFLPFAFSCTAMIAMFYMLFSIYMQSNEQLFIGANLMQTILGLGTIICGIFSVFVVFYTNRFLIKRRSREFGLYSILGMEKKHIVKVVFWEIAIIGTGSIVVGLLSGILFSKLMFMLLLNILRLNTDFAFKIMPQALIITAVIYIGVFLLIMIVNSIRIFRLNPVELLSGSSVGEREPKAKWIMAIAGGVCLASGYYLALTTQNPMEAMNVFFIAVLFVIVGTYMLFMAGSVAILKILKKNKKFYYHRKRFITVSGLIYRMRQNAVGLANICILSTAVIVVLSTTVSLYVGMENVLGTRYPKDVMTSYSYQKETDPEDYPYHYDYDKVKSDLQKRAEKYHIKIQNVEEYYSYYGVGSWKNDIYTTEYEGVATMVILEVVTLEDYNKSHNKNEKLLEDEIMIYTLNCAKATDDKITIIDKEFKVKKEIQEITGQDSIVSSYGVVHIVVNDFATMQEIRNIINSSKTDGEATEIEYSYNFDLAGDTKNKEKFCTDLREYINDTGIAHTSLVENRYTVRQEFFGIYGSLFFIGIFIGAMFLITTVMIIYYKQISEGYEDREKFEIMQKVGLSKEETKSIIKNQILLVFLFPISMAVVHICFAFDIIKKLLEMLNLTNVKLFVGCTAGTIVVFIAAYAVVYLLTARTYYRITNHR